MTCSSVSTEDKITEKGDIILKLEIYHILTYVITFLLIFIVLQKSRIDCGRIRKPPTPRHGGRTDDGSLMSTQEGEIRWSFSPIHFSCDYKTTAH